MHVPSLAMCRATAEDMHVPSRAICRATAKLLHVLPTLIKEIMDSNKIYVAIGKEVEERESTLQWVLKEFMEKTICVIYVHVPAKRIPLPSGLELPVRLVRKNELETFRSQEREKVLQVLNDCTKLCALHQVPCETRFVEKDSITEGILELIYQLKIEKLVMGAAANHKYRRGMTKLMSEKATKVLQFAPAFCHVWFICKGHLIYKREGVVEQRLDIEEMPSNSSDINNHSDSGTHFSQAPVTRLGNSVRSGQKRGPAKTCRSSTFSPSTPSSAKIRVSDSNAPSFLTVSSYAKEVDTEQHETEFSDVPQSLYQHLGPSSPSESIINGTLNNRLEQGLSKTGNSWSEAYRKSVSSWNADRRAMETIRKGIWQAKPVEKLYIEELRLKIAMKEEAANMKSALAKVSLERDEALDQKMTLESQVGKFNLKVMELETKMFSEMLLSQKYKDERDELQIERECALREAEELRKELAKRPSIDPILSEFSYLELQEATNYFDRSLKIGEGDYGSMYKGFLHHTQVTIKLLAPNSMQNRQEFDEQVNYLSKLRHPNLVTLMGVCREPWALIYEYLPGGTLEDRLIRHNLHSPVPWQMRIRIAMDICSALIFLFSTQPNGVSHGGLSPNKLLLDENFTCKITDFGLVSKDTTLMNLKSDVHIFGIIVLQLLTGKQAELGISKEVERAVKSNALDSILDPLAGDWPYVQAEQLAHMALRCCNSNRNDRPDLASDVWRVLAPMRASCSSLSSLASRDQPPHYFTCPILQEIMEDPHFAADGFTYEAEAIRGWLESGHDTSPMTNMKLAHQNLTPNRALRSLIQEWLQTTSTK